MLFLPYVVNYLCIDRPDFNTDLVVFSLVLAFANLPGVRGQCEGKSREFVR